MTALFNGPCVISFLVLVIGSLAGIAGFLYLVYLVGCEIIYFIKRLYKRVKNDYFTS